MLADDFLAARAGSASDRNSPRLHAVRGHFKVRKHGVYWWSDFMRGDPRRGSIRTQTREVTA